MSSFFLDVIKDRMYCSGKNSQIRKSAQTAIFEILKNTLLLMAPILPFTTEEAWEAMPSFENKEESVHLGRFPDFKKQWLDSEQVKEWEEMILIRENVLKELERVRENRFIGNSLEAQVILQFPQSKVKLLKKYESELPSLFIVSSVELKSHDKDELKVVILKAPGEKCER